LIISNGLDTGNTNDFNQSPANNIARLINFLYALRSATAQVPNMNPPRSASSGLPSEAVARVSRWFEAHQEFRPATTGNVKWRTLDHLRQAVRSHGPVVCSEGDLGAAIAALPKPGDSPGEIWDTGSPRETFRLYA
jgi:hypothetical protein